MGLIRDKLADSPRPRGLARTTRLAAEEGLPWEGRDRYAPTMVQPPLAGARQGDVDTDATEVGGSDTGEDEVAERLTRERIHRSLFGDLTQAPTIGRYTFLKELGQGGMGVVCMAYDPKLDRKVAIKLTRSIANASVEGRGRILREAQAMARLSHPNVVQVYEVGELREQLFVAMEYIDGVDLSEWLAAERRSWREVQRVFLAAGRGLAAAHAAGLVHRDFKPANVFIGADGRVLVGDFGLARAIESEEALALRPGDVDLDAMGSELATPLTATGMILGTPAYMAPECFERNASDASADIFAFSVALFEALHGVRPFGGPDVASLVLAVLHEEPKVPARSEVPGWLQRVALRGLKKRPEERWRSMDALLAALAFDPDARARGLRRAAVAVSAVTASVVGFGWLAADARERAAAEESAKIAAEAARDRAFDGLKVEAARSEAEASRARDALRLAALRRFDSAGRSEHVDDPTSSVALLREVEDPERLRGWRLSAVEALEGPIASAVLPGWRDVAFTPDGSRVVTQDGDASVLVWRSDGQGAPVTLGAREGAQVREFALSPDGEKVAIGYRDGLVRVHTIDGAGAPIEIGGQGSALNGLSWRADSGALMASSSEGRGAGSIRRSRSWDLGALEAAPIEVPGRASFMPTGALMVTVGGGEKGAPGVWRGDGAMAADFPGAEWLVAAPAGDAVLAAQGRGLQRRGLDGRALGARFDHEGLLGAGESVVGAAFTPSGARVISTTSEDRIFVWDTATSRLLREVDAPPRPQAGMLQWGGALAVSPDGSMIARSYQDRSVWVWDVDGRSAPMVLHGHLHEPNGLAFTPDGGMLATATIFARGFSRTEGLNQARGDFDYTIRLWPIPKERALRFSAFEEATSEASLKWISHSPWTPDGRLVVVEGRTLRLLDAGGAEAAPPVTIPERYAFMMEPIVAADGGSVTLEAEGAWVRWDLRDPTKVEYVAQPPREELAPRSPREHGKGSANLSRDGSLVYYLSPGRDQVRVHRFDGHALIRRLDHEAPIVRVEFSPAGDQVMTVSSDRKVRVWRLASEGGPAVFEVPGEGAITAIWSPDGGALAVGAATANKEEAAFHVWRPGAAAAEHRLTTKTLLPVTRVSPDGRWMAVIGADDRVRLVSTAGEVTIRELDAVDSRLDRLDFSGDGAWLIGQASHAAYVWSVTTGAIVRVIRSPGQHLTLASFDPSGARVLLVDRDGVMTLAPFDAEVARAGLEGRLRSATSYCYGYARRRVDLNEPPALAWEKFAACERSFGRAPGAAPAEAKG